MSSHHSFLSCLLLFCLRRSSSFPFHCLFCLLLFSLSSLFFIFLLCVSVCVYVCVWMGVVVDHFRDPCTGCVQEPELRHLCHLRRSDTGGGRLRSRERRPAGSARQFFHLSFPLFFSERSTMHGIDELLHLCCCCCCCWAESQQSALANQGLGQSLPDLESGAPQQVEEVEEEDDDAPVDETGLDSAEIDTIISQVGCSRAKAVRTLREKGSLIDAIVVCFLFSCFCSFCLCVSCPPVCGCVSECERNSCLPCSCFDDSCCFLSTGSPAIRRKSIHR